MATKERYYESHGLPHGLAERYVRELAGCKTVLDIGCGTGEFGRFFPGVVHGVDNDAGAVALAARHEQAVLVDLELGRLPYEDASFDGVLVKDVLEHLRDPWVLVREIERVLGAGGVVVASLVQARPRRVWADYTHVRGFTESTARGLFEDAGFVVERTWPMGGVPLSNRLGFTNLVPRLLRVPGLGALWASSWELRAIRA